MPNPPDIEFALRNTRSKNPVTQEAGTNYLIAKFTPMIHKLANQICPKCDVRDMSQAGTLGVLMAIKSYNGTSQFSTWVYQQVRNQLQQQQKIQFPVSISRFLLKKGCTATFEQMTQDKLYVEEPAKNIISEENSEKLIEAIRKIQRMFTKKECQIFAAYYFENTKLEDLTKKYHLNCKYVISKIMEELRKQNQNIA